MTARVLVIDNYDSFTYNLVQYLESLGASCDVRLNDAITAEAALASGAQGILLSPGPGTPDDAGVTLDVIRGTAGLTGAGPTTPLPILGVCLGHQSIGQAFGGTVVRAARLMHGKTSPVLHDGRGLFAGIPSPVTATRYHSLVIDPPTLPACLEVTASTAEGEIMAVTHKELPIWGVQFHPESILTEHGLRMIDNWLRGLGREGMAA